MEPPPDAANANATSGAPACTHRPPPLALRLSAAANDDADTVFDELPPETVSIIFRFLSPEDLNSLRTVCRRFRDMYAPTLVREVHLRQSQ